MLGFLRDVAKPPLTRQGVPRKKGGLREGEDDTVAGAPTGSAILQHYSVERATTASLVARTRATAADGRLDPLNTSSLATANAAGEASAASASAATPVKAKTTTLSSPASAAASPLSPALGSSLSNPQKPYGHGRPQQLESLTASSKAAPPRATMTTTPTASPLHSEFDGYGFSPAAASGTPTDGSLVAPTKARGGVVEMPEPPTEAQIDALAAERDAARRLREAEALRSRSKAEVYAEEALSASSPYVLSSPPNSAIGAGAAAIAAAQEKARAEADLRAAAERAAYDLIRTQAATELTDQYFAQRHEHLAYEERTQRNNLFVESRALVLMVMREWRLVLDKYKARHPERFHGEVGYLKPNRFWLVRGPADGNDAAAANVNSSTCSDGALPPLRTGGGGSALVGGGVYTRPNTAGGATAAAQKGSRLGTATASRRIAFADGDQMDGDRPPTAKGGPSRVGSAAAAASPYVQIDLATGRGLGSAGYDPATSPYRAPAGLRERQFYSTKGDSALPSSVTASAVLPPAAAPYSSPSAPLPSDLDAFSPYSFDKEYDLRRYLAGPDAFDPRKLGEKKVVVLGGDGSVVASTLNEKDMLIVDEQPSRMGASGEGEGEAKEAADAATDVAKRRQQEDGDEEEEGMVRLREGSPLRAAVDESTLRSAAARRPAGLNSSTLGSSGVGWLANTSTQRVTPLAASKARLRTMTRDGGVVVIAPPVGGYDDDDVPIISNDDADNNDSDREDYELDDAAMLRRDMLFGDKAARAARKQADWDLYELKSRDLRRRLGEEAAARAAAEEAEAFAAAEAEREAEEAKAAAAAAEAAELALLTDPLRTTYPPMTRKERAERMAKELQQTTEANDTDAQRIARERYGVSASQLRPLSGNPAGALARLRVPSRKYYTRKTRRECRETEAEILALMDDVQRIAVEEAEAILLTEASTRRALEKLALELALITKERIRQLEWDRLLGSQQHVISAEEIFLRATYWQEERATRYNLYHWFDDTFEEEVAAIRDRLARDEGEVDRKMAHRKVLEDAEAERAYAAVSRRNQSIASAQNRRVVELRRNRIEREALMAAEYEDRMLIAREEIDCFHSPIYCDGEEEAVEMGEGEAEGLTDSIDGIRIGLLYPLALEALLEEYRLAMAQLTKDLSRKTPYDIAKAVGADRSRAYDEAEAEAAAAGRPATGKRYTDRADEEAAQRRFEEAAQRREAEEREGGEANLNDVSAIAPAASAQPQEEAAAVVAEAPAVPADYDDPQFSVIQPHVPFEGKEEPSAAERAAAADKANYQQFLQLVDEERAAAAGKLRIADAVAGGAIEAAEAGAGQRANEAAASTADEEAEVPAPPVYPTYVDGKRVDEGQS